MNQNESDERIAEGLWDAYSVHAPIKYSWETFKTYGAAYRGMLAEARYVRTLLAKRTKECAEVVARQRLKRKSTGSFPDICVNCCEIIEKAILALDAPEVPKVWCEHVVWGESLSTETVRKWVYFDPYKPDHLRAECETPTEQWTRCPICGAPRPSEVKGDAK